MTENMLGSEATSSPDGSFLLVLGLGKIFIIDPHTGKTIRENKIGHRHFSCCTMSPDGKHIYYGKPDGSVLVLDTSTMEFTCRFTGLGGETHSISCSPDGTMIAVRYFEGVDLIDVKKQKLIGRIQIQTPLSWPSLIFNDDWSMIALQGRQASVSVFPWNAASSGRGASREALIRSSGRPVSAYLLHQGRRWVNFVCSDNGCAIGSLEPIPFPFSPIIAMPRIRYSEDVKRQAVSLVVEDHFTMAEVAHEIGCSVFTLHAWLKKHRQSITPASPSNAPSFVPVHLVDTKTASVEIVTPGGFTLRLSDVSSQEIVELLTAPATC